MQKFNRETNYQTHSKPFQADGWYHTSVKNVINVLSNEFHFYENTKHL